MPGDDRQWIDGTDAQTVYLNYHDVATFNIEVQRSKDSGQTYVDGFGEAIDPQTFPAAGGVPATNSANTTGQIKVDRSSCASRNLYQIFVAPDNVTENLAAGALRSIYVRLDRRQAGSACLHLHRHQGLHRSGGRSESRRWQSFPGSCHG